MVQDAGRHYAELGGVGLHLRKSPLARLLRGNGGDGLWNPSVSQKRITVLRFAPRALPRGFSPWVAAGMGLPSLVAGSPVNGAPRVYRGYGFPAVSCPQGTYRPGWLKTSPPGFLLLHLQDVGNGKPRRRRKITQENKWVFLTNIYRLRQRTRPSP